MGHVSCQWHFCPWECCEKRAVRLILVGTQTELTIAEAHAMAVKKATCGSCTWTPCTAQQMARPRRKPCTRREARKARSHTLLAPLRQTRHWVRRRRRRRCCRLQRYRAQRHRAHMQHLDSGANTHQAFVVVRPEQESRTAACAPTQNRWTAERHLQCGMLCLRPACSGTAWQLGQEIPPRASKAFLQAARIRMKADGNSANAVAADQDGAGTRRRLGCSSRKSRGGRAAGFACGAAGACAVSAGGGARVAATAAAADASIANATWGDG